MRLILLTFSFLRLAIGKCIETSHTTLIMVIFTSILLVPIAVLRYLANVFRM